jgi:aminoglycoside phosphotransferase (APT) family kinase protein
MSELKPESTNTATKIQILRTFVERLSGRVFPELGTLVDVECAPSRFISSYGADIIALKFDSGNSLRVFRKDFRLAPVERRDREMHAYRHLLSKADLGTARYYGEVVEESSSRYWLFLEYVPGLAIKHREFEYWVAGAHWLGRMQSYFETDADAVRGDALLARHDRAFFSSIADAAVAAVHSADPSSTARIQRIVEGYSSIVTEIVSTPQTLAHGDYKPIQILVNEDSGRMRVCPVDWEKCAVGSMYYDLATLTEGFEPAQLTILIDAFLSAAPAEQRHIGRSDVRRGVEILRLNAVLNRLRMSHVGGSSQEAVLNLLERAERQANVVMSG